MHVIIECTSCLRSWMLSWNIDVALLLVQEPFSTCCIALNVLTRKV